MTDTGYYDPRVDSYIDRAAEFAQPILNHIRSIVHRACPDVREAIKWGMPFFTLRGKNLANMAAFKAHAAFGFWEGLGVVSPKADEAMGHFGKITALDDLPADDELHALIRTVAKKLETLSQSKPSAKKIVQVPQLPEDFSAVLVANPAAQETYDAFAPGNKRDYIEWITDAKRQATREKRINQAVDWMAKGKDRNWKYR